MVATCVCRRGDEQLGRHPRSHAPARRRPRWQPPVDAPCPRRLLKPAPDSAAHRWQRCLIARCTCGCGRGCGARGPRPGSVQVEHGCAGYLEEHERGKQSDPGPSRQPFHPECRSACSRLVPSDAWAPWIFHAHALPQLPLVAHTCLPWSTPADPRHTCSYLPKHLHPISKQLCHRHSITRRTHRTHATPSMLPALCLQLLQSAQQCRCHQPCSR